LELNGNENNVKIVVPVAPKKFNGLIAFSLNKEEYAAAERFFAGAPGKNLQLKIKAMVLESVKDNNLDGVGFSGGQVETSV
jgi:hypothetical protein